MQKFAEFRNHKDKNGRTAFHWACRWGKTSNVNVILDNGKSHRIDLTIKDNTGRTGFQLPELCKF